MLAYDDTHSAMDKDIHRFFFEWVDDQRKYHMVNWATMCKPKVFGGLGIINTKWPFSPNGFGNLNKMSRDFGLISSV
jgi:hypothetical protein